MADPLGLKILLSARFPVLRTGLFEFLTLRAGGKHFFVWDPGPKSGVSVSSGHSGQRLRDTEKTGNIPEIGDGKPESNSPRSRGIELYWQFGGDFVCYLALAEE